MLDLDTPEGLDRHRDESLASSEHTKAVLARVAEIAVPEAGWSKLLSYLATLALAEWMEGDIHVELTGDEAATTVVVYSEHGVGIRERVLPPFTIQVPIDELQRAVLLAPKLVSPLVAVQGLGRLALGVSPEDVEETAPLDVELDETSLGDSLRATAPPPPDFVVEDAIAEAAADSGVDPHTRPTSPPRSDP